MTHNSEAIKENIDKSDCIEMTRFSMTKPTVNNLRRQIANQEKDPPFLLQSFIPLICTLKTTYRDFAGDVCVLSRGRGGTSLVAQWLRIHPPMQGTRVRALVQEDPTCRGATKPVRHNY